MFLEILELQCDKAKAKATYLAWITTLAVKSIIDKFKTG